MVRLILDNNNVAKTTKLNLISVLGMIGNSVCMKEDALPVLKVGTEVPYLTFYPYSNSLFFPTDILFFCFIQPLVYQVVLMKQ